MGNQQRIDTKCEWKIENEEKPTDVCKIAGEVRRANWRSIKPQEIEIISETIQAEQYFLFLFFLILSLTNFIIGTLTD